MDDVVGKSIDRYEIVDELGRGGMAAVYKAFDKVLERYLAVKIILSKKGSSKLLQRFDREAKALAQLSHPNIVKVMDYGEFDGRPYLVMEYFPGGTLEEYMGKPMQFQEAAKIMIPIARALGYAHDHQIIHRDVKPANILFNESGQPMLSDFGIAKVLIEEGKGLTATGVGLGTPSYMAPEQAQGLDIDARADVYGLGVVLYELVTGVKPFTGNTPMEIAIKHVQEPLPHPKQYVPDLPDNVVAVLARALQKDTVLRYQNMDEFANALEDILYNRQAVYENGQVQKSSNKALVIGGGVVGGIILIGLVLFFILRSSFVGISQAETLTVTNVVIEKTATATETVVPTATETATPELTDTALPTETDAPEAESTPTIEASPTEEVIAFTAIPQSDKAISIENIDQLEESARREKISIIQLAYSPDGKYIADASAQNLRLLDSETLEDIEVIGTNGRVERVVFAPDAHSVAAVLWDNSVRIWDLENFDEEILGTIDSVRSLAISSDGERMAFGILDGEVEIWDIATSEVIQVLGGNYGGWSVAFSPDGKLVAAGSSEGTLMWEVDTGTWMPILSGYEDYVSTLKFSPDGKYLAAGATSLIRLWDVSTGQEVYQYKGHTGNVNSIAFSPDGTLLASASDDMMIKIWHVASGEELKSISGYTSKVYTVAFSPDGKNLLAGANEGVIRVWAIP